MRQDDVTTNYNDAGTINMEMINADSYFSPGGLETTTRLMKLTRLKHGCRVLDIDLIAANVAEANLRTARFGLAERLRFFVGNAEPLPFLDQSFDVV